MGGFDVLQGELLGHAGKVDALTDRLSGAADAANTVAMNDSAYGVVCQPFAQMLQPFEQMGVRALRQAAETLTDTAERLRDTVKGYEATDAAQAAVHQGIEGAL
jgi:Excreted virulence factor EspC, type VII ESX diderm